jgi:hypothetical protein
MVPAPGHDLPDFDTEVCCDAPGNRIKDFSWRKCDMAGGEIDVRGRL